MSHYSSMLKFSDTLAWRIGWLWITLRLFLFLYTKYIDELKIINIPIMMLVTDRWNSILEYCNFGIIIVGTVEVFNESKFIWSSLIIIGKIQSGCFISPKFLLSICSPVCRSFPSMKRVPWCIILTLLCVIVVW